MATAHRVRFRQQGHNRVGATCCTAARNPEVTLAGRHHNSMMLSHTLHMQSKKKTQRPGAAVALTSASQMHKEVKTAVQAKHVPADTTSFCCL
jgi:hypothetical protein